MITDYAMIPGAALTDDRVSAHMIRVLAIIAYKGGNKPKGCWHTVAGLAAAVGVERRLLSRYTADLVAAGYLSKEERRNPDGGLASNVYRVVYAKKVQDGSVSEIREGSGKSQHEPQGVGVHNKKRTRQTITKQIEPDKNISPPSPTPKAKLITLEAWEAKLGSELRGEMLTKWVAEKGFCPALIKEMISEFRVEMKSKGKLYADFRAAFQTWITHGYLRLKPNQLLLVNSPHGKQAFRDKSFDRGVAL